MVVELQEFGDELAVAEVIYPGDVGAHVRIFKVECLEIVKSRVMRYIMAINTEISTYHVPRYALFFADEVHL